MNGKLSEFVAMFNFALNTPFWVGLNATQMLTELLAAITVGGVPMILNCVGFVPPRVVEDKETG